MWGIIIKNQHQRSSACMGCVTSMSHAIRTERRVRDLDFRSACDSIDMAAHHHQHRRRRRRQDHMQTQRSSFNFTIIISVPGPLPFRVRSRACVYFAMRLSLWCRWRRCEKIARKKNPKKTQNRQFYRLAHTQAACSILFLFRPFSFLFVARFWCFSLLSRHTSSATTHYLGETSSRYFMLSCIGCRLSLCSDCTRNNLLEMK